MDWYKEEFVSLAKLELDGNNSRHSGDIESQREIIEWMTSANKGIGEKVFSLARDIAEKGVDPFSRVVVYPNPENEKKFIVLEGNRRVTALKLLNNPNMAPAAWQKKYTKLAATLKGSPIKKLRCTIVYDLDKAFHFMEVKHLGELGGVGTVSWGAEEKSRHHKRQNKRSSYHKSLNLLDHIRESGLYDESTIEATDNFPISTLDRLLGDVDFRASLGLGLDDNGELVFLVEANEVKKAIVKIIADFGGEERKDKKKVKAVMSKVKRKEYRDSFSEKEEPNKAKALESPVLVNELDPKDSEFTKPLATPKRPSPKTVDPRERKKLVLSSAVINIDSKKYGRPRRIYEELRALSLQGHTKTYPNAVSLLMRTFIEMSIKTFIKEKSLTHPRPTGWKDISLTEQARAVCVYIKDNDLLEPQQLKVITKVLGDKKKMANPNSLNDYVHNAEQVINAKDLIDIWDTYVNFLSCIWKELSEK